MSDVSSPFDSRSLWQESSGNRRDHAELQGPVSADVVIVGAGILGLSAALHAAARGLSVIVLEAARIAAGATGRNAGFVVPNFARRPPDSVIEQLGAGPGGRLIDAVGKSADLVFGLIQRHNIACSAQQSGWINPAHSRAALERLRNSAAQWQARGRPVRIADADETARLTGIGGYVGSLIDSSAGVINPVQYARGLADAAIAAGAKLFEQTPALAFEPRGDGWIVATPHGHVTAGQVLIATNAYGASIDAELARNYLPLKIFQIATQPLPAELRQRLLPGGQCLSDTRRNLFTYRFDDRNRLISGGMHVFEPGSAERVPAAIHRRLARHLGLADLPPVEFAWTGLASVTPDFLPRVIAIKPAMFAAFACNGRGIATSTMLGKALGEAFATGTMADVPVPVTPSRPLPLHRLASLAPNMLLPWSMLRDRIDVQMRA